MSRIDHGVLNVPLSKRGNIDAQIDRYKAEQAKAARKAGTAAFHEVRAQKARVRDLLARIGDHRIMALAKPLGSRMPASARAALYQAALTNLPKWIAALEREHFPAGGCAQCWAPLGQCDHSAEEWMGPA